MRHPKLTAELRQQVLADWTRLQAIHAAKSATKHSYSVDSVTVEQAPDSVIAQKMQELQSADSYLARCMRELADERSRVRDIVVGGGGSVWSSACC